MFVVLSCYDRVIMILLCNYGAIIVVMCYFRVIGCYFRVIMLLLCYYCVIIVVTC